MGMGVHDDNFSIAKVENATLARMSTVSILAVAYLDMAYVFYAWSGITHCDLLSDKQC